MNTISNVAVLTAVFIFLPLSTSATMNSPLYENVEVLGALDCEIDGDIRLYVGTDRTLQCDYEPRDVPDGLKRYRALVGGVEEGIRVGDGDFACWSVLRLIEQEDAAMPGKAITGSYSTAASAILDEFELKEATLVASGASRIALEPRCVAPRSGNNIADKLLRIGLAN